MSKFKERNLIRGFLPGYYKAPKNTKWIYFTIPIKYLFLNKDITLW